MSTTLPPKGDASVAGASQPDRITDHDLLGGGDSDGKPEVEHHSGDVTSAAELTPEELELEKKLKKKIDTLIMPLVVLVYLMNYIDRYVYVFFILFFHCYFSQQLTKLHVVTATIMPQPGSKASRRTSISATRSTSSGSPSSLLVISSLRCRPTCCSTTWAARRSTWVSSPCSGGPCLP